MKYRALVEKLDWRGSVVRSVMSYEDALFVPNVSPLLEKFVKTGQMDLSLVQKPSTYYLDILKKIAKAKSSHSFSEYEPGIRKCAGEYIAGAGIQFVVKDGSSIPMKWVESGKDAVEGD